MKKGLLIAGASVLLLSGLAAGVFARYQTSVDAAAGQISSKQFAFTAAATYDTTADFKLAPTESKTVGTIKVSNYDANVTSEVAIKVNLTYTISGTLYDEIKKISGDSLVFQVKDGANVLATGSDVVTFTAGTKQDKTLTLVATWNGDANGNSAETALANKGYTANYKVTLVGTQA